MTTDNDLNSQHYIGSGIYAKEWRGKAGQFIEQHKHKTGHLSYLASGKVMFECEGSTGFIISGPVAINIAANKAHKITALTDCLWLCIHPIPESLQGESVGVIESELTAE